MDLGAGLCTRTRPACGNCPVSSLCLAHGLGQQDRYPVKSRRLTRRHESWWLLVQRSVSGSDVWLERRPARGIWAGLYSVPVFADRAAMDRLADLPTTQRGHRARARMRQLMERAGYRQSDLLSALLLLAPVLLG